VLTQEQKDFYDANGYLLVEDAVTPPQLARLLDITDRLIDASRAVTESSDVYDLDDGHGPAAPRLTRIKIPHQRDPYFWDVLRQSAMTEVLTDLLGPDTQPADIQAQHQGAGRRPGGGMAPGLGLLPAHQRPPAGLRPDARGRHTGQRPADGDPRLASGPRAQPPHERRVRRGRSTPTTRCSSATAQ
jgi:hypothetical protein